MFSIEELLIAVFCCVDDLREELTQGQPIRQSGFAPALVDRFRLASRIPEW